MKAWTEFTKVQKILSTCSAFLTAVVVIGGMIVGAYFHFATRVYADAGDQATMSTLQEHIEQNTMSSDRSEILRLQREIKRLNREKRSPVMNDADKAVVDEDIEYYNGIITCIREGNTLCV